MPFRAFRLRGEKILVRVDEAGQPVTQGGRADVIYKPGGKIYRAGVLNLTPDANGTLLSDAEAAPGDVAPSKAEKAASGVPAKQGARGKITDGAVSGAGPHPADAIIAYTDGACTGNPGPMGAGVVLWDPLTKTRRELSEYLGTGTNNIAELVAIQRAIELSPPDRVIVVHSDSSYSLGLLALGWKAKANQELVAELRAVAKTRPGLRLVKVPGHSGVPENERADELARTAITRRNTQDSGKPK